MMRRLLLVSALAPLWLGAAATPARSVVPPGTPELMHSGLAFPVSIRFAPDGRLFYNELDSGRIMVFATPTAVSPTVWATLPVENSVERGLLGLAIHPDFPDSPYVYAYHTNPSPLFNRVVRLTDAGGVGVNLAVLVDDLPAATAFHLGGRIAFGPDGMLYVSYGDQGNSSLAQDPTRIEGKILRLGRGGRAAPGNPFGPYNRAAVMGVRNVFGLCFDPRDGTGYFTENGEDCDDELNLLTLGANYGWGPLDLCGQFPAGTYPPLLLYTPTIAPTGCCFYRKTANPLFDGNLFFCSFNDGRIRRVVFAPGKVDVVDTVQVYVDLPGNSLLDAVQGPDGQLWFSSTDAIWRVAAQGAVGVPVPRPAAGFGIRPNPFLQNVAFVLPGEMLLDRIEVLDVGGRRVRVWERPAAGALVWDGRDGDGRAVPAGVYLARLVGPQGDITRRVVRIGR